MNRLSLTAALAALIVVSVGQAAHAQDRITVHIFAAVDASGFVDQDAKDRNEAVQDAVASLAKSKIVTIVPTSEDADVTLRVTKRVNELAKTSIATSMFKNNSWSRSSDSMQPFLYGTVAVGSYTTELRSTEPEGKGHGRNLAKVFEEWVLDNRTQVIAQRQSR